MNVEPEEAEAYDGRAKVGARGDVIGPEGGGIFFCGLVAMGYASGSWWVRPWARLGPGDVLV